VLLPHAAESASAPSIRLRSALAPHTSRHSRAGVLLGPYRFHVNHFAADTRTLTVWKLLVTAPGMPLPHWRECDAPRAPCHSLRALALEQSD
jgi:hypothetical protein